MDLAILVRLLTVVGLIAMMLSMGLTVKLDEVLASSRKPRQAAPGVLANFVLVPAVTAGLLHWINPDPMVSVGFLILAVCPGAPVGPPFAAVARGDVPYAVGQMVILAGLSAVLSPLLLGVLLTRVVPESDLQIDYLAIGRSLLLCQMLPLAAGLWIQNQGAPVDRADRETYRPCWPTSCCSACGRAGVGQWRSESLAVVRAMSWAGMLSLLAASLAIGWLCGQAGRGRRRA